MTVIELLDTMTPEERRGALMALDAVTRPLRAREIEHALRQVGVPKSRAVLAAASLAKIAVIAVAGEKHT